MINLDDYIPTDLHAHGSIGFESDWLKAQGYEGQNLFQLQIDSCVSKGIELCAMVSEQWGDGSKGWVIPRGSIHDRFGYLVRQAKKVDRLDLLSYLYNEHLESPASLEEVESGKNPSLLKAIKIVNGNARPVYIINAQTVVIKEKDGTRLDHLVIGGNDIPNNISLSEAVRIAKDKGYLQIAEHPFVESHYGAGLRLEEFIDYIDAVEHNAQMAVPNWMGRIPKIGKFTKNNNALAKEWAKKHNLAWIANSDAHRFEDIGTAYSLFPEKVIKFGPKYKFSAVSLVEKLRESLKANPNPEVFEGHAQFWPTLRHPIPGWWKWTTTFQLGILAGQGKYIPEQ